MESDGNRRLTTVSIARRSLGFRVSRFRVSTSALSIADFRLNAGRN